MGQCKRALEAFAGGCDCRESETCFTAIIFPFRQTSCNEPGNLFKVSHTLSTQIHAVEENVGYFDMFGDHWEVSEAKALKVQLIYDYSTHAQPQVGNSCYTKRCYFKWFEVKAGTKLNFKPLLVLVSSLA